jgi:hypothetical protein
VVHLPPPALRIALARREGDVAGEEGNQLLLVFTNPVAGRDDEYNAWYDEVHLADVCRVPGIIDAQRYELVPTGGDSAQPPAHRHLTVYELDRDGSEVLGELMTRAGGPEMRPCEALDLTTISMTIWRPRG